MEYVDIWKYRRALTKFRVSCHNLEIEKGRYEGVLLENRICKYCENNGVIVIEDEYHFLLHCPLYASIRNKYIELHRPTFELFMSIMSSEDKNTIVNLSKYIFHGKQIRENFLCSV